MATKKQIADTIRGHIADVADRGRVLGQALKVRADMAVTRRRLRSTLADLGGEIYERMEAGRAGELEGDTLLVSFQERISGLKAELRLQETDLRQVMQSAGKKDEPAERGEVVEEEAPEEAGE